MCSLKGKEVAKNGLPVLVCQSDLEKYPEFKKLLETLTKYIGEDGTTREVQKDFTDVLDSLRQEKLRYLQMKVIYEELKDVLLDHEISKTDHASDKHTDQLYKAMKDALTAAEVVDHLDCNPEVSGSDVTLLGLKSEQLKESDAHKMVLQQGLIPDLEKRLKAKCEDLTYYHHDDTAKMQDTDPKLAFAKATQLPAMLEAEKLCLEEETKLLRQDKILKSTQFVQYYQTLVHSLEVLEKLITHHKMDWQKKYDEITSDWLAVKCQAMCLKIRVLQNQLICDTYTPHAVAALKQIRQDLQAKENETKKELHQVMQALHGYKSVGMGFENLVRHYGDLLAEVDNKKWALTELRHSETQDVSDMNDLWK